MRIMGRLGTAVLAAAAIAAVAVGARSVPDLRRYLRIRQM